MTTVNYLHEIRGDYNIAEQRVRLNFKTLAGDPIQAQLTMMHEWAHRLLADTDFGQAIYVFYQLIPYFKNIDKEEIIKMANLLYDEEKFVQEGFATFIQYGRLISLKDRNTAEIWRFKAVNEEYRRYLDKLIFAFDFSQEERDLFSGKVSYLVMETGIRRKAVNGRIFSSSKLLEDFLNQEDNNPDLRLNKVVKAVKADKSLVHKDYQEIAKASGISYNIPSSKEEIAEFLNYLNSFTDVPKIYTPADITDALAPSEAISQVMDKLTVVNLSFNFAESAIPEFNHTDFLHYSDRMEIVFTTVQDQNWSDWNYIKFLANRDPEIGIVGFLTDGSKVITYTTREEASKLLNRNLNHVTFASHCDWYDVESDKIRWSETVRQPDIVVYDTTENMKRALETAISIDESMVFSHLHAGLMEDHPIQTLFVQIGGRTSIHIVNHFQNKNIVNLINIIRNKSAVMEKNYLLSKKKHLNNTFSSWMGLFWEVDWVEGMLDPGVPHFRQKVS